jgi:hypothetical protein
MYRCVCIVITYNPDISVLEHFTFPSTTGGKALIVDNEARQK